MNPFDQLLTDSPRTGVRPDVLEMLGHKAAQLHLQQKVPLNQAVVQAVKEHPELGNEHIKRVVEFANNVTFQEMFSKSEDKNIHFPVADPGVILRDLKDGGSPGHEQALSSTKDYHSPPTMQKSDELESGFADLSHRQESSGMFGQGEPVEKNAYDTSFALGGKADPIENVHDLHTNLRATADQLREALIHFGGLQKEAEENLYQAIKEEVLSDDGAGLSGVSTVLETIGGYEKAAEVLIPMVGRLMEEGVRVDTLEKGLEKRAGVLINPRHPISVAFNSIIKTAEDRISTGEALAKVEKGLQQTSQFFSSLA